MDSEPRKVRCPNCRRILALKTRRQVKSLTCPACQHLFSVPPPGTASPGDQKSDAAVQPPPLPTGPVASNETFIGFISYRHTPADQKWARWLHAALETYRVPKILQMERGFPPRLGKVFRDEDELPTSGSLSDQVEQNLRLSRFLIVVCSPRTPESKWVAREIECFRDLGRGDRILPLLIEGEPEDAYPAPLRCAVVRSISADGRPVESIQEVEPLAADFRPREGRLSWKQRRFELLRIVAPLLGCGFDDLRRRDEERQRRERLRLTLIATATLLLIAAGICYGLYQGRLASLADTHRRVAERKVEEQQETVTRAEVAIGRVEAQDEVQRERARREAVSGSPTRLVETLPEWRPIDDESRQTLQAVRAKLLNDLPTVTLEDCLMAMNGDRFASQRLPDPWPLRFVLRGTLSAVQHTADETWVYLRPRNAQQLSIELGGRLPLVAAVVFKISDLVTLTADYRPGEEIDVACESRDWGQFQSQPAASAPPQRGIEESQPIHPVLAARLREFRLTVPSLIAGRHGRPTAAERPSGFFGWCLAGQGLEKTRQPATWVGPGSSRFDAITNRASVVRSPVFLWRQPAAFLGAAGVVRGRFHSLVPYASTIGPVPSTNHFLTATLETADGPIAVVVRLGQNVREAEFLDYRTGVAIDMHLTFTGSFAHQLPETFQPPASTRFTGPEPYFGQPQALMQGVMRHLVNPKQQPPLDPMTGVGVVWADGHWVQQADSASTLVLAEGPRRQLIDARDLDATPSKVRVSPAQFVGRSVEWSGKLRTISCRHGATHLLMDSAEGNFEAFVPSPNFVDQLWDCQAKDEGFGADEVVIDGIVRPVDARTARLLSFAPLVELESLEVRGRVLQSKGSAQPVDPSAVASNPLTPVSKLLRKWPSPGATASFTAYFERFDNQTRRVVLYTPNPQKNYVRQRIRLSFPDGKSVMFADYRQDDAVEVKAIIPQTPQAEMGQGVVWEFQRILRTANSRSVVDAQKGRLTPPLDFTADQELWSEWNRTQPKSLLGSIIRSVGVVGGVAKTPDGYRLTICRLFLESSKLDLDCRSSRPEDIEALTSLPAGREMVFAMRLDGGNSLSPKVSLLWIAPADDPGDRLELEVPPENR